MTTHLNKSPVADIIPQLMRRIAQGNIIQVVTKTKSGADKDLGVGGSVTEDIVEIVPEPFVNALGVRFARDSGGAFRFSDLKMTVAKDSLEALQALDSHTEFNVNGDRYQILLATPGPSAWEFIIRQKTAEPVTP